VHVLFDETNPLIEHDIQDEEFKNGLVRKELSLTQNSMVDNGKSPEGETSTGSKNMEGGQGANQSGGSIAEPNLGQNRPTQPDPFRTVVRTGTRTDPRPVPSSVQERLENMSTASFTPRAWKHQSSYLFDQIISDVNTGVQTRSQLKNFCAFYAFLSNVELKNVHETLADSDWVMLCKRSFISSKGIRFGILNHGLKTDQ